LDELHREIIGLLKVIRAIAVLIPIEAQPVDILLDGLHILHVFSGGVGVVHPQVAFAAKFFRRAKIDAQGLAVADVQIAVGLRRESGVDMVALAFLQVLADKVLDKIAAFQNLFVFHSCNILSEGFQSLFANLLCRGGPTAALV
jgi:hypothetical protein